MDRTAILKPGVPTVCRLGLATRGNAAVDQAGVEHAIERGINYLNWCGHRDGMRDAIRALGCKRGDVVLAVQFEARRADDARHELESLLSDLHTDYIDVVTFYYVESRAEWEEIHSDGGAWNYLNEQKQAGTVRMIGLTTHQRKLASAWAVSRRLDMLMVRYNAAHRGAEGDAFPVIAELGLPVVTFTGLRWRALLKPTASDPPGFAPPPAADWYRFCLADPRVSVVLTAPGTRAQLDANLRLLEDWRPPDESTMRLLRAHGDRVRHHAGAFP